MSLATILRRRARESYQLEFPDDTGLQLIFDTLVGRGYPDDEVQKRLALWAAENDSWEPFASIVDDVEDTIFTDDEQNQVWHQ